MAVSDSPSFLAINSWLTRNGGGFHLKTRFSEATSSYGDRGSANRGTFFSGTFGSHIVATEELDKDTVVVECPFDLLITKALAKRAVLDILQKDSTDPAADFQEWTERQWICTYLALHWILDPKDQRLTHFEYLNTLPPSDKLRTPLHFTSPELKIFKGSNLYGATLDREKEWKNEWDQCRTLVRLSNPAAADQYTWDKYLTAATYLSSRAFPSSLLAETPSLVRTPSTEPILIPGVDSLNHKRGEPVSWMVTQPTDESPQPKISLVLHSPAVSGQELFNNYGPKPNSELILGYGFSLPRNPDDTIVLKVGGISGKKWEIGRGSQGAEGLWKEILATLLPDEESQPSYEDILDASGMLQDMVQALIQRLPGEDVPDQSQIRPEVLTMFHHYLEGQKDILQSLMEYAGAREQEAIELAREQGIDLQLEEE